MRFKIPISRPALTGHEEEYLCQCIRSGWVSSVGPYVERFEHEFAQFCDQHPDRTVVVYANTSAAVKARADWVVTSSNALKIVDHLLKVRSSLSAFSFLKETGCSFKFPCNLKTHAFNLL